MRQLSEWATSIFLGVYPLKMKTSLKVRCLVLLVVSIGLGVLLGTDDMVAYAKAQLGLLRAETALELANAIMLSHQPVALKTDATDGASTMSMFWSSIPLKSKTVLAHGGSTGEFLSFLALDTGAE